MNSVPSILSLVILCFLLRSYDFVFAKVHFFEGFDSDELKWVQSSHKSDYGEFKPIAGEGVQTSQDARFYALSKKIDEPISNKDTNLIVQYSVRHTKGISCGGSYIKLLDESYDPKDFHGETPYLLMFGPDTCGSTNLIHAIFKYNGKEVTKQAPIRWDVDTFTHTYTLKLNKDNTYVIEVDGKNKAKGSLEDDFNFLPPKKIKDPEAKKPSDWVDEEYMDDPEDTKPADWDKPKTIPDKDDKKPDDWDDENDGTWEPRLIDNPEYKGEWKPRQIKNPEYKGQWKHPMIDNPDYKDDSELYKFPKNIGGVGFDLWQVDSGSIFGNIIITDDEAEASKLVEKANELRKKEEEKQKEEDDKKSSETPSEDEDDEEDDKEDETNELDDSDDTKNEAEEPKPIVEEHDEL